MLQIIVDESFYCVWALNTAVAQNRLIDNLQSAFPQMLVENPARVKQCVRIALQVQLNHYKQLEASEGVFITKPGWHTDRNDELVYYVGPIRYAVHAAIAAANASGWQTTTELIICIFARPAVQTIMLPAKTAAH